MARKFKCLSNKEVIRQRWGHEFVVGEVYEEGNSILYGTGRPCENISYFLKHGGGRGRYGKYKYVDRECFELVQ